MVSLSSCEPQRGALKIRGRSHTTVRVRHEIFESHPSAAHARNIPHLNGLSRLTSSQVLAVDLLNPSPAAYAYTRALVMTICD
jgi:hypothetical protein